MPFTPFHMGPGILIKSLMRGAFSLMVFGWTQIVMDLQPLYVLIRGEGHLHGVSHTYAGAVVLSVLSAVTGKYLAPFGLWVLRVAPTMHTVISWRVAFVSAFIGGLSHVLLDSIMHGDVRPFYPVTDENVFWRMISVGALHEVCLYTGLVGAVVYFAAGWLGRKRA